MSWRRAHALEQLRAEVLAAWPNTTVWTLGDAAHRARPSDHNPTADGIVCAIDIVGAEQARAVWAHLVEQRDERLKYAIHDGQIVSSAVEPWQPRTYTGSNPHRAHVHVSVGRGRDGRSTRPDLFDDAAPWGLAQVPTLAPASSWQKEYAAAMETLNLERVSRDRATWLRGPGVRRLQGLLIAYGLTLNVDGIGGPDTRAALVEMQLHNPGTGGANGRPDAIAGPATWGRLLGVA